MLRVHVYGCGRNKQKGTRRRESDRDFLFVYSLYIDKQIRTKSACVNCKAAKGDVVHKGRNEKWKLSAIEHFLFCLRPSQPASKPITKDELQIIKLYEVIEILNLLAHLICYAFARTPIFSFYYYFKYQMMVISFTRCWPRMVTKDLQLISINFIISIIIFSLKLLL